MSKKPNPSLTVSASHVERLKGAGVAVIGDVMLDRYVSGEVERISPEAPIPVLRVAHEKVMLGGAGNVAANIAALGGRGRFVALVGNDGAGEEIRRLARVLEGMAASLAVTVERPSTIKTRFIAATQQMLRADVEGSGDIDADARRELNDMAKEAIKGRGAVVLSDYGKGVLDAATIKTLVKAAQAEGVHVVVDPKGTDFAKYKGADVITPNKKELAEASHLPTESDDEVEAAAQHIIKTFGVSAVLATRSARGMTLVQKKNETVHIATEARQVFDVSGAGDTVVSTLALALAAGLELTEAAALANIAAGVVVAKVGTATVSSTELAHAINNRTLHIAEAKVLGLAETEARVAGWRTAGLKVGFTNGCFDLLHPGHISLLTQARASCDRLVVGLNADVSVKGLKGDDRPIQGEVERGHVLAALQAVDAVVLFSDDTPIALIETLRPDVLVKGADYTEAQVVGGDMVKGWGGTVVLAKLAEGHSTTATVQRLNKK